MSGHRITPKSKRIVFFRGAYIPRFEAEVLNALEKQSREQFVKVENVEGYYWTGFSVEANHVTGIGIGEEDCDSLILPESIGELKFTATTLYLILSNN